MSLGLAAALLSACGGGDDDDDAGASSTTTTAPTSTTLSPKEEVKTAYLAYRQMVTRLLEAPDPSDPEIPQRATGQNLDFLTDRLITLATASQALRFGPLYTYEVVEASVQGAEAVVHDCTVDDAETIHTGTGEPVSQGTSTELLKATLSLDGVWRVRTIENVQHWEGAVACER